ncbi:UDP-glucose dehydrogenase family protein [Actinomyces marmotae]|uniref:UDP-glucose 6-dehydrogenase n=1 Tax=Actinomyces marmotae TaxID=2737173 RepID=A0A6M8B5X4_9ACTO|nr:UDP-glucose/GDP-mannose dehydrogenase family protein [Actinomyces marmotae]QKD80047.1 UDP-glucose/GDP-mannose dehydrogenase family protein [Actinomyces marmotae]
MRVSMIGCGYLGAVHAASMAEIGHDVVGIDVDEGRISALAAGRAPFFEPGFEEVLSRNVASGRLRFTTDISAAEGCQVHFIGVGTPQTPSGAADMTYVDSAVDALAPHLGGFRGGVEIVVGKSTVPVGTAARLAERFEAAGATLVWNPEFLREGFAVKDTLEPDRMVYGLPADPLRAEAATAVLDEVYGPILATGVKRLTMDYATAELVKVSANSFLAIKISFINAVAQICDAAGGDVTALAEAIGLDARIGHRFLRAGIGFGGGCLPKDIRAFQARAAELGAGEALAILDEADRVNLRARSLVLDKARQMLGDGLDGARVAILGAAFKPDSDDMRDSPALEIAGLLAAAGARVAITDPQAGAILAEQDREGLEVCATADEALRDADLAVLATEWRQFTSIDPARAASLMRRANIIDGRNSLDAGAWKEAGFTYTGMGRR